jgi:RNA polymerase sigma factor (sigma-70 family)
MSAFPRPTEWRSANDYQKLMKALTARAARMGARDPEGAAQEAVKRSLANALSRSALEYYFHEQPPDQGREPGWSLLQLLGWLHGVLRYVVFEERARGRREVPTANDDLPDVAADGPSPLQHVIDGELRSIVQDALSTLNTDHRSALLLRLDGTKYTDIATRLGVNENTVATWVHRGSKSLVDEVRRRLRGTSGAGDLDHGAAARVSNG